MPTLYNADLSPYAARVRLALRWKGLNDTVTLADPPGGLKSQAYLQINPTGKVPSLKLESGFVLPESELIVEYLDETYPDRPLRPEDPERRAKARLIARLADLYVAPGLGPLFGQADPAARDEKKVEAGFSTMNAALSYLEHYLDTDGLWAMGDDPSTADCALVPLFWFVNWAEGVFKRAGALKAFPKCAALYAHAQTDVEAKAVIDEIAAAMTARFGG